MPQGFTVPEEAQLNQAPRLLSSELGLRLAEWWLPADRETARTPNFDIASTCTIDAKAGLLLIEAKAHDVELKKEQAGRSLKGDASEDRKEAHKTIGAAIEDARKGLSLATSLQWNISRDTHYQMSNRFAWMWKLAELGKPVVLIYLGFLNATEMANRGAPFPDHASWESLVLEHSKPLFPRAVWNRRWLVNGVALIPLIKSIEIPFDKTPDA
jgi:hypothetical protein